MTKKLPRPASGADAGNQSDSFKKSLNSLSMGSGRLTVEDGRPDQEGSPEVFRSSLMCSQSESYKTGGAPQN
jgi:hypothetical protein